MLIDLYPHGYGDDDIIVLKKPNGDMVEAVEVRTSDTIYLVKISQSLSNFIANFEENIEKELESPTAGTEAVSEQSSDINHPIAGDIGLEPEED